jgi:hypothetical protein
MAIALNASACPAMQGRRTALYVVNAGVVTNGNAPVAENMITDTTNFRYNTIRPHATRLDLTAGFGGCNVCCILSGSNNGNELALVAPGSGLQLTIKAGQANIGGIVEKSTDSTLAVPDSHPGTAGDRLWIWLNQNGTLSYTIAGASAPAGLSCLLGSVTTSGGNITAVDTSGVCYLSGGYLFRESADPGIPTDTPLTGAVLIHRSTFCDWLWDGVAYRQINIPDVSSAPTSLANGMSWYLTTDNKLYRRTAGATKASAAFS